MNGETPFTFPRAPGSPSPEDPMGHLVKLVPGHADELYRLIRENREHLGRWLPWAEDVSSPRDTEDFIARTIVQDAQGRGTHHCIFFHGRIAGVAGFHPIRWPSRTGELGYWLGRDFTGRGLVTEACVVLLGMAFQEMDLNRMEIRCAAGNTRSIAVAKRLGMVYEGTLREAERLGDGYVDHVIHSILKREFFSWK